MIKDENNFLKEKTEQRDAWDELNLEAISVDTELEDFAENHDHYLYGTMKRV